MYTGEPENNNVSKHPPNKHVHTFFYRNYRLVLRSVQNGDIHQFRHVEQEVVVNELSKNGWSDEMFLGLFVRGRAQIGEKHHLVDVFVAIGELSRQIQVFVERSRSVTQIRVKALLQRLVVNDLRPKFVMR